MKRSAFEVRLLPLGVFTVTSTAPVPAGEVAVIDVDDATAKSAAAVPKCTAVAPVKLLPVIVTAVPPAEVPDAGLMAVTDGPEDGPTRSVVLAEMGEPCDGEVPLPSKGVTLVWVTVSLWVPFDSEAGSVSAPVSVWGTKVVPS